MRSLRHSCALVLLAVIAAGCTALQPEATPAATASATPAATPSETPIATPPIAAGVPGAIEGHLAYPSAYVPPLRVYAIDVAAPARYRVVTTLQNQQIYLIANLPPGEYRVFGVTADSTTGAFGGAYTRAVGCGLGPSCTDHTPLAVQVKAATVTDKVDVTDWYAPAATYPAIPTGREPFKPGDRVVVDNPYADGVNAREKAGLGARIVRTLPNGTELAVERAVASVDGYDWYAVSPEPDVPLAYVAGFALRRK
jgi:hypothetical protein